MNEFVRGEEIFRSKGVTNLFVEGTYEGQPVYAVIYTGNGALYGATVIFEHDEKVLKSVIQRVKQGSQIVFDIKQSGNLAPKFNKSGRFAAISLRAFLFAKYQGISNAVAKKMKIAAVNQPLPERRILDLRKENLYDAGGLRPEKGYVSIEEKEIRCFSGVEKLIQISYNNGTFERVEFCEYNKDLFELLAASNYCGIIRSPDNGRLAVVLHCGRGAESYHIINLGRFALFFYENWGRFQNQRGAHKRFMKYIPRLQEHYEGLEAAHVNSVNWLHLSSNLCWMKQRVNGGMRDWVKQFVGRYNVQTAKTPDGSIIIRMTYDNRGVTFIRCKTPELFLDFQKVMLSKKGISEHFKSRAIPSPAQEYKALKDSEHADESIEAQLWKVIFDSKMVLSEYESHPNYFINWEEIANGVRIQDVDTFMGVVYNLLRTYVES